MDDTLLVGGGVVLGVEDQLDVDAAVERGLQAFGGRQIAKFVETSEQRVARPCRVDEPEQGVVEIAAQPLQRFELPGFGLEVVRPLVAEAALIGLAAGDPAIEEDVVGERRIERLGAHADRDRRGASIEVFRPAPDRMEDVVVAAVGLGGEIVPDEALHRVVEGRDGGLGHGVRQHAGEGLHAVDEVPFVLGRVDALDGEAEQAGRIGLAKIDGEGDRVDPADRKDAVAADRLGSKVHGPLPVAGDASPAHVFTEEYQFFQSNRPPVRVKLLKHDPQSRRLPFGYRF